MSKTCLWWSSLLCVMLLRAVLPGNRRVNHTKLHLSSWMCHAAPSSSKITHHRTVLTMRREAEWNSGGHANMPHGSSLTCQQPGTVRHHPPAPPSACCGRFHVDVRHARLVSVSKSVQFRSFTVGVAPLIKGTFTSRTFMRKNAWAGSYNQLHTRNCLW